MLSRARAFTLGVASATSLLLGGCESTSAPTRPRVAGVGADQLAAPSAATHVVLGTGDPSVDVPAVQAAVDHGGDVRLKGHFSFDAPPNQGIATDLVAGGYPPSAEVKIRHAVSISGARDEGAEMTTIEGGTLPFYVDAPAEHVAIRGLRFVRPTSSAILVHAVTGLEIASTRIEGVVPFAHLASGVFIITTGGVPSPPSPGNPQNVSGTLRIERNDIDMAGGTAADNTLGVTVFSAGVAGAEVDVHVEGNRIRNTTEPAINFRRLVGHAEIERNVITTGSVVGTAARNQVIRVVNTGAYLVAHNSITCEWATTDAEGIGVFSQFAAWPMEHALIVDNDIQMRPPEGTVFTAFSAGIGVYGFAQGNVVRHNRIRGAARAALSIPVFPLPPQAPAVPADNAFIRNRFVDFTPSLADIFVGAHALRTRVEGPGTVVDLGDGTILER
jgi:hypothetical protein